MKQFKKWIALLLAALLMLSMLGCSAVATIASEAAGEIINNTLYENADVMELDPVDEPEILDEPDFLIPDTFGEAVSEEEAEQASEAEQEVAPAEEAEDPTPVEEESTEGAPALLDEDGTYTSKEDVALYIYQYGKLPQNFISKKEAEKLGWPGGGLDPYAEGKCIGGSRFGNYEGILPEKEGRTYTECDIDTLHAKSRGAKRIVFSNDGLIYYTEDHYEHFTLLYGEE